MEFNEVLYGRSSVRAFSDAVVGDEHIEALLRAAMAAPSAGNQQPWLFYVTRDAELLKALSIATPYAKCLAGANVGIIACSRTEDLRHPENVQQDMGAAVENLLLAAVDEGLGAVWLGVSPNEDRIEGVAAAANLPKNVEPYAMIAVGYPAKEPQPKCASRYDESHVTWL